MVHTLIHYPQRELVSKILLSYKLASLVGASSFGRTSIIRKRNAIFYKKGLNLFSKQLNFKKNLVIEVACTAEAINRIKSFKKNNTKVISFCEEGTGFYDEKSFSLRRINQESFNELDFFFSWGKWHNRAIKLANTNKEKIFDVGHPRLEISSHKYRILYEDQIKNIESKYGKFILVNTTIAEFCFDKKILKKRISDLQKKQIKFGKNDQSISNSIKNLDYKIESKNKIFLDQLKIIDQIQKKDNNVKVIIRPKPSVSPLKLSNYIKKLGYDNLIVDGNYSVIPWLHSCSAILHQGCTTAIEATLIGKPAVMFKSDYRVAKPIEECSFVAKNLDNASDLLIDFFYRSIDPRKLISKKNKLKKWYTNIDESSTSAIINLFIKNDLIEPICDSLISQIKSTEIVLNNNMTKVDYKINKHSGIKSKIKDFDVLNYVDKLNLIYKQKIKVKKAEKELYILYKSK